ncbi:hypothetical protein ABC502_14420 [Alkalimonas sp. NCh-2]|uniref:hypothetical protein n=1 Tax=Alkalimonas sp. NCh-2 TaxID=3144846 RepID=UPI0031F703FB
MDQKTKNYLELKIKICQALLNGVVFHVRNSEIDCVPVPVMTKTAAKKNGLVLKRGAKKVGTWDFQIGATSARGGGDLYLTKSFKRPD